MAPVWDNALWGTGGVLGHHVSVRSARNGSRVCKVLWVHEHYRGIDTARVSLLATLV